MKCNCCGREINDLQCKRSVRVAVESRGCEDYFHANLLCNICYEEILITLGAYLDVEDEQEGEWIRSSPFTDTMECSLCGYNIYSEEIETPYCPWCGKRLKGKFDDKDCDDNV